MSEPFRESHPIRDPFVRLISVGRSFEYLPYDLRQDQPPKQRVARQQRACIRQSPINQHLRARGIIQINFPQLLLEVFHNQLDERLAIGWWALSGPNVVDRGEKLPRGVPNLEAGLDSRIVWKLVQDDWTGCPPLFDLRD